MTASFTPAGAAEFPNDNPVLHQGVRWVCRAGRGPARALWRASSDVIELPSPEPTRASEHAAPQLPPPPSPPAAPKQVERRCDGPLQLDLSRIVLVHRVENVPPPPDFIYEPFVSSRARVAPPAHSLRPIHPRPCRVVDARQAGQRVQRGWRVDVAPCVDIGTLERRTSRHRGGVVAGLAARPPIPDAPAELQAANA